jgi:hypothetical protein
MRATLFFHANLDSGFRSFIQAQKSGGEAYYTLHFTQGLGEVCLFLDDAQCRQLMDVLGSRPDLPKSDAQIDAEAEPLDPMEHQKTRNAAIAEPLRSVVNAMSPHVGGEDAPF